ncbi:MAG: hypothetical protein WCJ61_05985 [Paludibacter sp.]
MQSNDEYVNSLNKSAQFALFMTSYAPLFLLLIIKQCDNNGAYFHWGGLSIAAGICFVEKFGLSTLLFLVGCYGLLGAKCTLQNIHKNASNGFPVRVTDVKNKNSESVNYIATYVIPFAFQAFDSWVELVSILGIIAIIYRIFIHSSLLLVNPLLSFHYGLFEIEFKEGNVIRNGMVITKIKYLSENESIRLYTIGHKMYYAIKN